jgi:Uma2 family endonuclease
MPQIVEPLSFAPEPAPNRLRWTRSQCRAIVEAGILTGRYELIDGEVINKMGQNPPHATAMGYLQDWAAEVFGGACVRIQSSISVGQADPDHNDPEPDVAVTRAPRGAYADRHPGAEDLLLVVEVSDTTIRFDRTTKAALYALAGIQEYWVLDLNGRTVYIHRRPAAGSYGEITAYGAEESVATLARPEAAVRVSELLP